MPGAKFPEGYPRMYHQIAEKLLMNRPAFLEVKPTINLTHARATFNNFRASWLRKYEYFAKNKDPQANEAYDTHVRLMSYTVTIQNNALLFTSKEIEQDLEMNEFGSAPEFFTHRPPITPQAEQHKGKKGGSWILPPLLDEINKEGLQEANEKIREIFPKQPREQIISDNPPLKFSSKEEEVFFMANGVLPKDEKELKAGYPLTPKPVKVEAPPLDDLLPKEQPKEQPKADLSQWAPRISKQGIPLAPPPEYKELLKK